MPLKRWVEWEALKGLYTESEINRQPALWRETGAIIAERRDEIARFMADNITPKTRIVLTGAGTSDYVGDTVVGALKQCLPCRVEAIATTDIVAAPDEYIEAETPTILVSYARSGNSPESMGAYDLFQDQVSHLQQLVITCDTEGDLAQKAFKTENALVLLMPEESNDKGFAMTGSFSCMMMATLLIFNLDTLEENHRYLEILADQAEAFLTWSGFKLQRKRHGLPSWS
ncbi:SIS domain-containing protein [Eubacterium aggregans]|uniref:SIS domain-containing protein n=1 Tax=Eubacterium aggregans TaxID=81409 RepID=A0A1H4CG86_9FIRM|nr:SIS domain-containing protein [Eubacterium aggregans]